MTGGVDYEHVGDPVAPYELTRADHRRQKQAIEIVEYVHDMLERKPPPPLTSRHINALRQLLSVPTSLTELMQWRLRLYCGHVAERTAHYTHRTVQAAFTGSVTCSTCGLDPATIVAAQPLRRLQEPKTRTVTPQVPDKRTPTLRDYKRQVSELEAENRQLRLQLRRDK